MVQDITSVLHERELHMNFEESNEYGKQGEEIIKQFLTQKGYNVIDVSKHKHFQSIDVDFVVDKEKDNADTQN